MLSPGGKKMLSCYPPGRTRSKACSSVCAAHGGCADLPGYPTGTRLSSSGGTGVACSSLYPGVVKWSSRTVYHLCFWSRLTFHRERVGGLLVWPGESHCHFRSRRDVGELARVTKDGAILAAWCCLVHPQAAEAIASD